MVQSMLYSKKITKKLKFIHLIQFDFKFYILLSKLYSRFILPMLYELLLLCIMYYLPETIKAQLTHRYTWFDYLWDNTNLKIRAFCRYWHHILLCITSVSAISCSCLEFSSFCCKNTRQEVQKIKQDKNSMKQEQEFLSRKLQETRILVFVVLYIWHYIIYYIYIL